MGENFNIYFEFQVGFLPFFFFFLLWGNVKSTGLLDNV